MADAKISELTDGTSPEDTDEIPVARSGSTLKLLWSALKAAVYAPGGTDVAVADGGTGSSTASGARTNLGVAIGSDVQAYDATLDTYAGIDPSANVQSVLSAADYAAIRTLLGLVIGTNVQAFDADLSTWAGLTPSAFFQTLVDDADAATARGTLAAGPAAAKYIVQTADSELSAEQALGALATGILKNTTTTGVLSIATEGTDYTKPGGTDVALADGGTGTSLSDPNADRIMFWDDSAGSVDWLTAGTGLSISGTTITASASGSSPSIVTSLPGSPSDDDEVYLQVGTGDTAILWHLKYDADITDSYKWRYLGGPPLRARVNTGEATSSTTYTNLTTTGPSVTIPYTGVYDICHGMYVDPDTGVPIQNVQSNGSNPANDDEGVAGVSRANADIASGSHASQFQRTIASIGTSAVVKCVYRVSAGGSATFYRRWIAVTPVRIG